MRSGLRQYWRTEALGGGKSAHVSRRCHYPNARPLGPRSLLRYTVFLHVPLTRPRVHVAAGAPRYNGARRTQHSIRATADPLPTEGYKQGRLLVLTWIHRQKILYGHIGGVIRWTAPAFVG